MEPIIVYVASVSYVYYDEDEGGMRERGSDIEFVTNLGSKHFPIRAKAENHAAAVDAACAWAKNRYEAVYKNMLKRCEIGCIKIYQKCIGVPEQSGYIPTHTLGCLFEWKYDWPGTQEQYVQSFKDKTLNDPALKSYN
jgi:hypothetical protein